jgi:O-antigen/teichoic acid export membrane protein
MLAVAGALTVESALLWLGIAPALAAFATAIVTLGDPRMLEPPAGSKFLGEARMLLRGGLWLWVGNIAAVLNTRIDVLAVQRWTSGKVGAYALAASLAGRAGVVNGSVYAVLVPRAAAIAGRDELRGYIRQGFIRGGAFSMLLAFGTLLAGPVIGVLYGLEYQDAVPLLQGLLAVAIVDTLAIPFAPLAIAFGKTRLVGASDILRLAVFIAVTFFAVPMLGPAGVVLARLASAVVSFGMLAAVVARLDAGRAFKKPAMESA